MPYDEKQLAGYVLLIDKQGTAQDDIAAPPEGQTLLYTTEQGLVLERSPSEGFEARQWFLDQPALLSGGDTVSLSDTPQSLLDAPYTVPDDIDAAFPTFYRLELQVYVENFAPDTTSIGIMVQATVSGVEGFSTPPILVPCDAASGLGGATVTFFVIADTAGLDVDVVAYTLDAADGANASASIGLIKRELRLSFAP
jgi:hypothetical protein